MANLFLFASNLPKLPENNGDIGQTETLSYGVKSSNQFRVTSSFNIKENNDKENNDKENNDKENNVKAYAITSGTVFLQYQKEKDRRNQDKVNLILKPNNIKDLKLPVKYFIYRGIKSDSFIKRNGDNTWVIESDESDEILKANNDFISKINVTHRLRFPNEQERGKIPLSALGLPSNERNENGKYIDETPEYNRKLIDSFFFTSQNEESELFPISSGTELGVFAPGKIGLDVVLEGSDFPITVEMATKVEYIIEIPEDIDEYKEKWQREEIRNYVDPAAFYGLHTDNKNGIAYYDAKNIIKHTPKDDTYSLNSDIIYCFYTKNNIYLDIRNENGYSYNYYKNYTHNNIDGCFSIESCKDDNNNNNNNSNFTSPNIESYSTEGWPIYILNASKYQYKFIFSPVKGDNDIFPVLIVRYANEVKSSNRNIISTKDNNVFYVPLFDINNPGNINEIVVRHALSIYPSAASIIRIDYIKKTDTNNNSAKFPQKQSTDFIFAPIDTNIPWDDQDVSLQSKWYSSHLKRYVNNGMVNGNVDGIICESGVIKQNTDKGIKYLYYAYTENHFNGKQNKRI